MPWIPMLLRGTRVFARCDEDGKLVDQGGRVEIRYKAGESKAYQAASRNLTSIERESILPDEHCSLGSTPKATGGPTASKKSSGGAKSASPHHPDGAIIAYADGACSGNPGPAGLGVIVKDGSAFEELSEFLGEGTNNIAELTAILRAAEKLRGAGKPIRLFTDSSYSIGVLTKGWKAKANVELVARVKEALRHLPGLEIHYVPGHAGVELNEKADELARRAVVSRQTTGWVETK